MNKYFDDVIKNLSALIKFDSSQAPAVDGKPFGEENARCLDYFLSLASGMGFEVENYDNFVGEVRFGEGEDFAVLAHLDVVPAGSGWTHEPFGGEIDEASRRIWGRGAMDDKGPALIALYAMKALKDEGFKPAKTVKLILGCNEETGWACIDHYNKVAKMPETGISPDADFPVIYAEKGIVHLQFEFPAANAAFSGLAGGGAANMVCDYCTANAPVKSDALEQLGLEYAADTVTSRGKSAHGSTPEKGVNAIEKMLVYLGLTEMKKLLFVDKFGLSDFEDETGRLTFSPNVIAQKDGKIYVTCDVRYPATYTLKKVLETVDKYGVPYVILHEQAPLYNDKNSKLITTLLDVYNAVTGANAKPVAIGGGTYARALKFGAAFGPEEDGEECTIHQPDEYITFEKIEKCFKIYKLALERLCK
ncbi:MAG: Sapep family Mn(2+)-dependent dipeptidase [Clostridia bacterium]|nr:Sapep family Mn(2+)-dependent dipeptidase [Clostridia bacterium]